MKRLSCLVVITTIITLSPGFHEQMCAQQNQPFFFSASLIKSESNPLGFKNLPATIEITLKYWVESDTIQRTYMEVHPLVLNDAASFSILIGTGGNQSEPWNTLERIYFGKVCYKATIEDPTGDVTVMGERELASVPLANLASFAIQADNTLALGEIPWVADNADPDPDGTEIINYDILIADKTGASPVIKRWPITSFLDFETGISAVNQEPVEYFIKNDGITRPIVFGSSGLEEIENFHTYCFPQQENLFNGVGFKFINSGSPLTHPTAMLYAENTSDPLGVALHANGRSRGIYSQGQTGVLGICNNTTGNGSGLWGYIGFEPNPGDFNYAVLASANGFPNTYAGYFQGNLIYTGTLTGPSDRALKTETRAFSPGLETIMKLRPATYQYRSDVPYGLPAGMHYGFIAQEMEEVMPDLVSDIPMIAHNGSMQPEIGEVTSYKGINYLELIPVLTKAIQDLNTKVDAQAEEIKALRQELKACSKPK